MSEFVFIGEAYVGLFLPHWNIPFGHCSYLITGLAGGGLDGRASIGSHIT